MDYFDYDDETLLSINALCSKDQHDVILSLIQGNPQLKKYLTIFLFPSFPNCSKCIDIALFTLPSEAIEQPGCLGRNALIASIILGENNFEVIQKFVDYKNGYLVNLSDTLGRTSLHYAIIKGDLLVTKYLINYGNSDVCHKDHDGNNVLHQFFWFNVKNSKILDYLLTETLKGPSLTHQTNKS